MGIMGKEQLSTVDVAFLVVPLLLAFWEIQIQNMERIDECCLFVLGPSNGCNNN